MEKTLASLAGALALCITSISVAQEAAPKKLPIEHFTKFNEFGATKISPDGESIAVATMKKGKATLSVISLKDGKTYGSLGNDDFEFGRFDWVSNTRIIYELAEYFGDLKAPQYSGEIFAVDRDMKNQAMIYGYRAGNAKMGTGTILKIQKSSYAIPTLISTLRNDDRRILISEQKWREDASFYRFDPDIKPSLTLLDVYTGDKRNVGGVPLGGAEVLVDHDDQPRFAVGLNEKLKLAVAWKPNPKDAWQMFALPGFRAESVTPRLFGDDNDTVFVTGAAEKESYIGLYRVNLKSMAVEKIFAFPDSDISGLVLDFAGRKLVGVTGDADNPVTHWLDETDATAKMYAALHRAFPKQSVSVTDASADGAKVVVEVSSDTSPGDYYVFETKTMKAFPLYAVRPWVDPAQMRLKEAFSIKARDGLKLHGYLTRPAGAGPYPLVVLPHGGPHQVRDYSGFDTEVQLLANRGYAVLQLNFRGSSGFGIDFEEAGYGEWGAKMQDDLTDATHWAIEQKVSTPDRICIYGASYGGYAALMGAVREPRLYKCAIGYVGVYDLELLYSKGDTHTFRSGRDYLKTVLGTDKETLRARSPVYHAEKIEIPVLLIHGKEDWRADIEHARRMKAALEKNNKSVEWMVLSREGHGVYDEDSRREVYERVIAFLDKHLMSGTQPPR